MMADERWTTSETISITRTVTVRRVSSAPNRAAADHLLAQALQSVASGIGAPVSPAPPTARGRWLGPAAAIALGLAARPAMRAIGQALPAGRRIDRLVASARTSARVLPSRLAAVTGSTPVRALPEMTAPADHVDAPPRTGAPGQSRPSG